MSEAPINLAAMAAAAAEAIKPKIIWKTENFWNQDGARIEHRIIVSGEKPKDFPEWLAHGAVEVQIPVGQDKTGRILTQPQRHPIFAIVEATTVDEASDKAKDALSVEADKFKKAFEEQKEAAMKRAQEQVAANNTRKILTQGLPDKIR